MSTKTPAKTTVKVAVINNAAKDDTFNSANDTSLSEGGDLTTNLNVLANDPGAAKLLGVMQNMPAPSNSVPTTAAVGADGWVTLRVTVKADGDSSPQNYDLRVKVNSDGTIDFDLSSLAGKLDFLGEGQSLPVTFYYLAQMANGAYSIAKVTVEIAGENDVPVFTTDSVFTGELNDTADDDSFGTVTGTVSATDVDQNDTTLTFSLGDDEDGVSDYGTFEIDASGNWTFTPDDAAVEGLKTTEEVSFTIKVSDGHGGSATQTVTITLNGVNDTAEISGDDLGAVTEDGTLAVSGTLVASDRDSGDVGFQAQTAVAGTYGTFSIDADGNWTYTLDNDDPDLDALDANESDTEEFVVMSTDGTEHTVTVTVNGANEAPTAPVLAPVQTLNPANPDPNNNDSLGNPNATNESGNTGANTIYGGAGNDVINGNNGNDTIYGGSGDDQLNGNNHNDALYGGDGNDVLTGSNGVDLLVGGYGGDTLTGSADADTFKFLSVLDRGDSIIDFDRTEGDKIDVSAIGFTGGFNATATANGLWQVGNQVYGDKDGDLTTAEFHFTVNTALQATDFIL